MVSNQLGVLLREPRQVFSRKSNGHHSPPRCARAQYQFKKMGNGHHDLHGDTHHDGRRRRVSLDLLDHSESRLAFDPLGRRPADLHFSAHNASHTSHRDLQTAARGSCGNAWTMDLPHSYWTDPKGLVRNGDHLVVFWGLSLQCVLNGLPIAETSDATGTQLLLSSLGACALAVVLGFVSLLPGGAGVREVVLSTILAPSLVQPQLYVQPYGYASFGWQPN